jgi:hypothetical protein
MSQKLPGRGTVRIIGRGRTGSSNLIFKYARPLLYLRFYRQRLHAYFSGFPPENFRLFRVFEHSFIAKILKFCPVFVDIYIEGVDILYG